MESIFVVDPGCTVYWRVLMYLRIDKTVIRLSTAHGVNNLKFTQFVVNSLKKIYKGVS
jgi:hypothetical protein